MAKAMTKLVSLMLLALLLAISMAATTGHYGEGSLKSYQWGTECDRRCKQTQYKKPCLFFCSKCCGKCLCVPPGYYGNKAACPCYNNWKTKRGGPKCP